MAKLVVIDAYGQDVKAKAIPWKRHPARHTIVAKGYLPAVVNLNAKGETKYPVLLWIDPKRAKIKLKGRVWKDDDLLALACKANVFAALKNTRIAGERLDRYFQTPPIKAAQDRVYLKIYGPSFQIPPTTFFTRTGTFRPVPGKHHKPHEPGWDYVGSWKTTRGGPTLQVTLWKNRPWGPEPEVAELDLDYGSGIKHAREVIWNKITGDKTHPFLVVQMLVWCWGCQPFRLEPGE